MVGKERLRSVILNKIKHLSDDQLNDLHSYLEDLEREFTIVKSPMSFSGIFEELDLDELTTDLHQRRGDGNKRIPNF
ncbi:MAG: hypothetical protein RIF33_11135 [Cyclobacteriaceae bacterium]